MTDKEQRTTRTCVYGHLFKPLLSRPRECRECKKIRLKKWRAKHKEHTKNYSKLRYDKFGNLLRSLSKVRNRRWYLRNRETLMKKPLTFKTRANRILRNAVVNGQIIKPSSCESCHKKLPKKKIDGHHADYSKPLKVKWLCRFCHAKEHKNELS